MRGYEPFYGKAVTRRARRRIYICWILVITFSSLAGEALGNEIGAGDAAHFLVGAFRGWARR